jgi:hypothetical protein
MMLYFVLCIFVEIRIRKNALPRFSSLLPLVTEVTPFNQTCKAEYIDW